MILMIFLKIKNQTKKIIKNSPKYLKIELLLIYKNYYLNKKIIKKIKKAKLFSLFIFLLDNSFLHVEWLEIFDLFQDKESHHFFLVCHRRHSFRILELVRQVSIFDSFFPPTIILCKRRKYIQKLFYHDLNKTFLAFFQKRTISNFFTRNLDVKTGDFLTFESYRSALYKSSCFAL